MFRLPMLVLLGLLLVTDRHGHAQEPVVGTFYTAVNIWCHDPREILSTNYHLGDIIPVGTKVTLVKSQGINIVFSTQQNTFTIVHVLRHSTIKLDDIFTRLFTVDDPLAPGAAFHKFTKQEQKAVAEGTVYEGMTRRAVLMAYGYPPSHRTPDIEADTWIYWLSKRRTVTVKFNADGKVESVEGLPEKVPEKGKKK